MSFARISMVTLSLVATLFAASPVSHAGESISHIAQDKQQKQIVINFLRDRLEKHKKMTTEQILADLNQYAAQNHATILREQTKAGTVNQADTAQNFEKLIAQETDKLRQFGNMDGGRDAILLLESARLQEVSESDNYMLYMMNHGGPFFGYLVCSCGDPTISLIFGIFLVPFDIVALPIEFIITAITGF